MFPCLLLYRGIGDSCQHSPCGLSDTTPGMRGRNKELCILSIRTDGSYSKKLLFRRKEYLIKYYYHYEEAKMKMKK
jgi:hypothetical protein